MSTGLLPRCRFTTPTLSLEQVLRRLVLLLALTLPTACMSDGASPTGIYQLTTPNAAGDVQSGSIVVDEPCTNPHTITAGPSGKKLKLTVTLMGPCHVRVVIKNPDGTEHKLTLEKGEIDITIQPGVTVETRCLVQEEKRCKYTLAIQQLP